MRVIKLLRTASPEANLLAVGATLLLLIKILVLNHFPAFLVGVYEFGLIAEAVLASVIASYVFYLIVVHVKEHSDRAIVHPYVEKHAKRVIGDCQSQVAELERTSGVILSLNAIAVNDVSAALTKIHPYSQAPLIIGHPDNHGNWFQYFSHYAIRTKSSIRRLLDQLPYLDAQLIILLTAIDDCSHFNVIELVQTTQLANQNLSAFASGFYEYCTLCSQLSAYIDGPAFARTAP